MSTVNSKTHKIQRRTPKANKLAVPDALEAATPSQAGSSISPGGTNAPEQLKRFLATFTEPSARGTVTDLGNAPPCRTFRAFMCVDVFNEANIKIAKASTKEF